MANDDKKPVNRPSMCRIEIMFTVTSDEQALKIKRDIGEALNDIVKKQFKFTIIEG